LALPVFTLQAFIISLATGAVGALLGLGGGVFMVPLLVFLLGVPLQVAAGASILAVLATSIAAAKYVKDDMTNMRLGLFLELATTIGALTGAFAVPFVSDQILSIVFGLTLVYAAGTMFKQIMKGGRSWVNAPNDGLAERLSLGGSFYDTARGETIEYGVCRTPVTFGISYFAGIISGLLGIGGGAVKVPAMNVVGNIPMKAAVATSNFRRLHRGPRGPGHADRCEHRGPVHQPGQGRRPQENLHRDAVRSGRPDDPLGSGNLACPQR
jgi:uncharacterized membrane protein YfcA